MSPRQRPTCRAIPCEAVAADYRRRARRLRHLHAEHPARLHRSLRELSAEEDERVEKAGSQGMPGAAGDGGRETLLGGLPVRVWRAGRQCEPFAQHVAAQLEGPILRYSARLVLLREAQRRGIGRFEANLVIAAVQHRVERQTPLPQASARRRSWVAVAAIIVLVQSTILAAVWGMLWGV